MASVAESESRENNDKCDVVMAQGESEHHAFCDHGDFGSDEEDPVVAEIPVNLAHFSDPNGFYGHFYGVKFPTRPPLSSDGRKRNINESGIRRTLKATTARIQFLSR